MYDTVQTIKSDWIVCLGYHVQWNKKIDYFGLLWLNSITKISPHYVLVHIHRVTMAHKRHCLYFIHILPFADITNIRFFVAAMHLFNWRTGIAQNTNNIKRVCMVVDWKNRTILHTNVYHKNITLGNKTDLTRNDATILVLNHIAVVFIQFMMYKIA